MAMNAGNGQEGRHLQKFDDAKLMKVLELACQLVEGQPITAQELRAALDPVSLERFWAGVMPASELVHLAEIAATIKRMTAGTEMCKILHN